MNGPLEVSLANFDANKAHVDVVYRPRSGMPGVNERYKEKIVKSLCECCIATHMYPRTQISVQLQELDDHGGVSYSKNLRSSFPSKLASFLAPCLCCQRS